MSSSYTQFCAQITRITAEEEEWLTQVETNWGKEGPYHIDEDGYFDYDDTTDDGDYYPHWSGKGFDNTVSGAARSIYLAPEDTENAYPGEVAVVLQAFLRKFRPDDYMAFEVSFSCNRAYMPEGFGGAAYFITAEKIEYSATYDWVIERYKEFHKEVDNGQ